MANGFTEDQRRTIFKLARTVQKLPKSARRGYLESNHTDPEIAVEALQLAEQFDTTDGAAEPHIGRTIGRFQVKNHLRSDSASEVYIARDPELARMVEIKVLRPESSQSQEAQTQSTLESIEASTLNHPNIVTVHEVVRTGTETALVLELVDGVPLRQLCGKALPAAKVVDIGRQIADALVAAHAAGVTHGSLKPENVTVRADGQVKVSDFGLARFGGSDVRYSAPEQSTGQPPAPPSDIFALGRILYELSTGLPPSPADAPAKATIEASDRTTQHASIPAPLDSTIYSMLEPDPAKRSSAANVAAALQNCEAQLKAGASARVQQPGLHKWMWIAAAFVALIGAGALYWKMAVSGTKLRDLQQVTTLIPDNRATAAAISGDGKILSFANADGVFIRVLDSGETTLLKGPRDFIVDHLAWLPDGSRVVASGFHEETHQPAVWLLSIMNGPPRELRKDARHGKPSPDGSRIAFLAGDYTSIWTMSMDGQDVARLIDGSDQDSFLTLLWSPNGRYLLFQRLHYAGEKDHNFLWFDKNDKLSFDVADAKTGRIVGQKPELWVRSAVVLPDGEIFFLSGENSSTDQLTHLWSMRMDSVTGKLPSKVIRVDDPSFGTFYGQALTATAKGDKIAFIRQQTRESVFVADFQKSGLRFSNFRRLTLDESASYPHSWTADSQAVIFESTRNAGSYDLFVQKLDQRVPEPLVTSPKRSEVLPQLSPDGKYVLYAAGTADGALNPLTLLRVPVGGGSLEQVPLPGPLEEFRCSASPQGRCVVRKSIGQTELVYSELDPIRGAGRELARTPWVQTYVGDWDISPDGRFVVIPHHDAKSARIRVLRLDEGSEPQQRELDVPGLSKLSVVSWAADGSGWFISSDTTIGRRMHFLDLHGHVNSLGTIHGWAVPAPDGKKVAFLNNIIDANVWTVTR